MRMTIVLLVIGALVAGVSYWRPWQAAESQGTPGQEGYYTVTLGDVQMTLTERGTLKTQHAQAVRSQIRGRARIEWLVDEGSEVAPGQVLVELDKTELEKEIEELDNKVIQLESELKAAETEVTIQIAQNLTDTEKANLELEVAQVSLEKFTEGDVRQERRKLELAIDKAQTEVAAAEFQFKTLPEMLEKDFITQVDYNREELNKKTAEQDLESAKLALALYEQYQYPLDLKEKKAAVTEAERNVDRATKQAEAYLEGKKAVVRQKQRSLAAATERLNRGKEDMKHMTLRSERGGIVFYGDPDNSRRAEEIKVGAEVWPNRNILTIPDPTRMMAVVKVHESDISKVREGGRATVRSEIDRNESYTGEVLRIGSVANAGNRRWGDNVRRFDVEVSLAAAGSGLKPGTSAEVELDLGAAIGVIFVPLQAVYPRDGRFYAYKRVGSTPTRVEVRLGRANEAFVEIVEGLALGDQILLYQPKAGEAEIDTESELEPSSDGSEPPLIMREPAGPRTGSPSGDGVPAMNGRDGRGNAPPSMRSGDRSRSVGPGGGDRSRWDRPRTESSSGGGHPGRGGRPGGTGARRPAGS